jgi:hypothetical protein
MSKKKKDDIIANDMTTGTYQKTIPQIEEIILKGNGTNLEKLTTFIYSICGNDMETYNKTIDLLTTIDQFKNKLKK